MRFSIKNTGDKITVAVAYMIIVEFAVSLALAINFMYDYHFFTYDSSIYPVQKAMSIKTGQEIGQIEEYIALHMRKEFLESYGKTLNLQEQASYNSLSARFDKNNTNLVFVAEVDKNGEKIENDEEPVGYCYSRYIPLNVYVVGKGTVTGNVKIFVRDVNHLTVNDSYGIALKIINIAHSIRFVFFALLFILLCLAVFLLGLLMSGIENAYALKERKENPFFIDRVPLDLLSFFALSMISIIVMTIVLTSAADLKEESIVLWNAVILLLAFLNSLIILVYCLSLARRIKMGNTLKNTVIYRAIMKVRRKNGRSNDGNFRLPILGKALITIGIVLFFELLSIFIYVYKYKTCISGRLEDFNFLPFAFMQLAVLFVLSALFFLIFFNLNSVRERGKKIAQGDFDAVADSHIMFGDFKAINDDLITIKDDMIQALQEKNKSQEMRNELITNLSHDIKTPLTAIVSYADIISSGKCTAEEVVSYSEILTKQSSKLSELLFNIIEVSKISSGTMVVDFDTINVQLFLSQTIEEFSMKLKDKNLTIESKMPQEDVYISADGKKLWRVFENLFSNIIKYAMPNTRVHLDVENDGEKIIIMLKNISEKPILSDPDDLVARFKRDDSSRHTEGNGLGLSIAKSFIEVQNGKFDISVDGDLFKIIITFDRIETEE